MMIMGVLQVLQHALDSLLCCGYDRNVVASHCAWVVDLLAIFPAKLQKRCYGCDRKVDLAVLNGCHGDDMLTVM